MKHLMKSLGVLLVCLCLLMALLPSDAFAADTISPNSDTYFRTSYSEDNYLDFTIKGSVLYVSGCLHLDTLRNIYIYCGSERLGIRLSGGDHFTAKLNIRGNEAEVIVYTNLKGTSDYWGTLHSAVFIRKVDGEYRFLTSPVLENNQTLSAQWINPADTLRATIPEAVRTMSDTIVGSETDDYRKIFLLYQWVAENIHYNYDATGLNFISTEFTLVSRQAVCTGFARLLRDLILAQNIPCMESTTFALGYDTHGKTFAHYPEYGTLTSANHAHTEAFVNGRWVVMDPTWDSRGMYQNGVFTSRPSSGYTYFDVTPDFFAMQHKLISRNDRNIQLQKDGTVVNHDQVYAGRIPSSWALNEASKALSLDLIPNDLQGNYQSSISRQNFCRLIVNMLRQRTGSADNHALLAKYGKTMTAGLFTDTTDSDVYTASLLGIVNGVGNGLFVPNNSITRQEAAAMLTRAAGVLGIRPSAPAKTFFDMNQVASWAADSVRCVSSLVSSEGTAVMGGTGTGFSPLAPYTVEQSILTVYRLFMCI